MEITTFNVPKIRCGGCAEAITNAVRPVSGVRDVEVNIPVRLVQVVYDDEQTTPEALKTAIESAGYPVQRYSANER